jgi:hypothetical protein
MGSSLHRLLSSSSASQVQQISSSGGSTGSREPTRASGGGGKQKGWKQAKRGSLSKQPSKSDQDGQQQQVQASQQQDRGSAGSQEGPGVSRSQSLTREGPSPRVLRPSTSGGGRSEAAAGSHNQRPDQSPPGPSEPETLRPTSSGSAAGAAQASPLAGLRSTLNQFLNLPARLLRRAHPAAVQQDMGSTALTGGASNDKGRKRQEVGVSVAAGSSVIHDDGPAPAPAPASASPVRHDPDRGLCLICLERLVTHRGFLHANSVHTSFCAECAESIMATPGALCPVCRVPIDSMVIIY